MLIVWGFGGELGVDSGWGGCFGFVWFFFKDC